MYATARNISAIADLADYGCELLALDVTDEESMVAAVDAVVDRHGAVGALVNNAAIASRALSKTSRWNRSVVSSRPTSSG